MNDENMSAVHQTLATPELLEHILTFLPHQLLPVEEHEDPRSVRIQRNAQVLQHLLRCSEVSRGWAQCIRGSKRIQRVLFLEPDPHTKNTWERITRSTYKTRRYHFYIRGPAAPQLNPIIQTIFTSYLFRFWHLSLDASGGKRCAYLIITRREIPAIKLRNQTGQGRRISEMLLSQPPCTALEATIRDDRDPSREYVGATVELNDSIIECESGVTLGMVHDRVWKMFQDHKDVSEIKLTTM